MNIVQKIKLLLALRGLGGKVEKMTKKQWMTLLAGALTTGLLSAWAFVAQAIPLPEAITVLGMKLIGALGMALGVSYNVGQGIADAGKEAEKERTKQLEHKAKLGGMPGQ